VGCWQPTLCHLSTNDEGTAMQRAAKYFGATLAAVLLLSFATSTAGARVRIEVSTTAALLSGILTFFGEGGVEMRSEVTLHVTLLRLINKVRLEHVGEVTSATFANCSSPFGSCVLIPLVPMRLAFGSIRGTLPRIERGILLYILVAFLLLIANVARCLYRGLFGVESPENPARLFRILSNGIDNLLPLWEDRLTFSGCERRLTFAGTLTAVPLITIRLLER
jgi:hypothetical protein